MAGNFPKHIFFFIVFAFFVSSHIVADGKPLAHFSRSLNPSENGFKHEKLTHLHFYYHNIVNGPNATNVKITNTTSKTFFGGVVVADDPLTVGPELTSKIIGRAQGFYPLISQSEIVSLFVFNFVFTEGEYNGSTISLLGRNREDDKVKELPIVGGTGVFRFAKGYLQATTWFFDTISRYLVYEFNVFIYHY